jgi:formylglycine-generating enzyme required for sulfatase activity
MRRSLGFVVVAIPAAAVLASCGTGRPGQKPPPDLAAMVRVPAGEFVMGRDTGSGDERPQRRVMLDEFYIDRTEVTNAQFKAYCDATNRLYPANPGWSEDYFLGAPTSPVVNVTFDQAQGYCAWAGKRLPTEAEWEKAARGTDGRLYPWGDAWADSCANLASIVKTDAFDRAAPVGSFPRGASPWGALDMAGNVWEWCSDWYEFAYYSKAPAKNPTGPATSATDRSQQRIVRGGGYSNPKTDAETPNRSKNPPDRPLHHVGCRCAWSRR